MNLEGILLIDTNGSDDSPCTCTDCTLRRVLVPIVSSMMTDPHIAIDSSPSAVALTVKAVFADTIRWLHQSMTGTENSMLVGEEILRDVYNVLQRNQIVPEGLMTPDPRSEEARGRFERGYDFGSSDRGTH